MRHKNRRVLALLLSLCVVFCSACGITGQKSKNNDNKNNKDNKKNVSAVQGTGSRMALPDARELGSADGEHPDGDKQEENKIYIIMENDLYNRQLTLCAVESDTSICYEYTDGTEFFNKYGDYAPAKAFSEGKLVQIKRLNSNETLGAVAFTDQTWDFEKVANYSVDRARELLAIADENYRCRPETKVFTDTGQADVYAVGEGDVLDIYGQGKDIYSIVVRNGNGTLALKNTKLFEGGWLNLGTQVYTIILKDMQMDIPEGVYDFSVANNGYGDSGQIRIQRGKTTTIDLEDYKGEGPKMCRLNFHVGVDGASLALDGKKVDAKQPLEVAYGVHTLSVSAAGYDTWTKQLVANSPKADIDIKLDGAKESGSGEKKDSDQSDGKKSDSSNKSSSKKTKPGSKAGTLAGSLAGSHAPSASSGSSGSGSQSNSANSSLANAALSSSLASIITGGDSNDYLDTLSNLVDSLDRLKKSSSKDKDDEDE